MGDPLSTTLLHLLKREDHVYHQSRHCFQSPTNSENEPIMMNKVVTFNAFAWNNVLFQRSLEKFSY